MEIDDDKNDMDPMDLLSGDSAAEEAKPADETKPEAEKTAAEPAKEEAAGEAAKSEVEAPVLTDAPQQQPGTPDKVLQQLQQDNAAALRRIEALESKKEPLTLKEEQQLSDAKSKLASVKKRLAEQYNVLEDGEATAEAVVEIAERLEALEKQNKQFREELSQRSRQDNVTVQESRWKAAQDRFPGVDVKKIHEDATAEARKQLGPDASQESVNIMASALTKERATAVLNAKKSVKQNPVEKPVATVTTKADPLAAKADVDDELSDVMDLLKKKK